MKKTFILLLCSIVLLGAGCISTQAPTADQIKTATDALLLKPSSSFTLKSTVLGLGGIAVDFLGGQSADRVVTLSDWKAGDHVAFKWTLQAKEETQSSIDARNAYDTKYKTTPVGTTVPPKPDQQFETKTHAGSLLSSSLATSHAIFLPMVWVDGDAGVKGDNGLLWLSSVQYDSLIKTKKTALNLGLFDNSVANAAGVSDTVQNTLNLLKTGAAEVKNRDDVLSINADQNFGTYTLNVNGTQQTVQTIEASNWFGHYSILANRDNPLILSVTLSPASTGNLNIFSKENLLNGFPGYQVTSITTN